eukprot:1392490-Amorphochlora_amoeboformis.AAC.1
MRSQAGLASKRRRRVGWHRVVTAALSLPSVLNDLFLYKVIICPRRSTENLLTLFTEFAPLSQTSAATGGLAKDGLTRRAEDNGVGVTKHCRDVEASRALNIHEEGVRLLHQTLELVELGLVVFRRMAKVVLDGHGCSSMLAN